jgi:hypothetical protein
MRETCKSSTIGSSPLRILRGSWPPLAAWLAALAGLWLVALAHGHHPWHPAVWAHWDSTHYASIARHGYELHRCTRDGQLSWCGNDAWFPGYPLLLAALHLLGVPVVAAGVAVAWACALAALLVLWHAFLRGLPPLTAAGGLAYAAWAPGQVYEYAVYPLSLLVLATLAYLHFLRQRRWGAAGVAGACAALAYPVGVALAAAAGIWILVTLRHGRGRALATACAPLPLAFLAVLGAQRVQTGRWTAYFDVERTYEHGLHDPLGAVSNALILWHRTRSLEPENVKGLQTLVVTAILVAVVVAYAAWRVRGSESGARHPLRGSQAPDWRMRGSESSARHPLRGSQAPDWRVRRSGSGARHPLRGSQAPALLLLWALVVWAVPLTQGNISVQRSQAALAPLAILVARLPKPVLVVAVAAVVALSEPVARLYFDNRLI